MQVVQFLDSLNGFRNFDHLLFKKMAYIIYLIIIT